MRKNNQAGLSRGLEAGNGSTIAIIIVVLVLLAGAIYMWRNQRANTSEDVAIENDLPSDEEINSKEAALNEQSDSDEISAIEADLKAGENY